MLDLYPETTNGALARLLRDCSRHFHMGSDEEKGSDRLIKRLIDMREPLSTSEWPTVFNEVRHILSKASKRDAKFCLSRFVLRELTELSYFHTEWEKVRAEDVAQAWHGNTREHIVNPWFFFMSRIEVRINVIADVLRNEQVDAEHLSAFRGLFGQLLQQWVMLYFGGDNQTAQEWGLAQAA